MNLSFIKAIVWAVLIFIGSALSGDTLNSVKLINIPGFDKFIHFVWYFFLFLFLAAGTYKWQGKTKILFSVVILVICIVYGGMLELLQGNVFTKRSEDVYDFIANSSGAIIGSILFSYLYRRRFWKKWL
jgi:VanZ family protein